MLEIEDVGPEDKYHDMTEKYLDFQLGHISERVTVVDQSLLLPDALDYFKKDESLSALAIEEFDKVVGVLSKDTVLSKASSRFEVLKGKSVKEYVADDSVQYIASDFCEKAFYEIMRIENRKINYLIILEGSHFFGIIPINHLIRHVTKMHELAYAQAHYIQQFFLDKSAKQLMGLEFADFIKMAHQIGGDFFHIREISETQSIFACFDVASKDIAASLTTGLLSSFFSMYFSLEREVFDPERMVDKLNKILTEQTPADIFVVALVLFFDLKKGIVRIYNHGYSPLYVCTPTGPASAKLSKINPSLMPLGISPDIDFKAGAREMAVLPHSKVFIYSDGLLDAINVNAVRYGEERLQKFVAANIKHGPEPFLKALLKEYETYTEEAVQVDDFTAIMVEVL